MKTLFDEISGKSAKLITKTYSTSFSIAVNLLAPSIRQDIYNIYGFVRVADEIVDSFEGFPKEQLLNDFEKDYQFGATHGISANPVINAFLQTIKKHQIDARLVDAFLSSMRADLTKKVYVNQAETDAYIYGSADVVGLMCLKVFVKGEQSAYEMLKTPAMKLGSAFQKVNFLRDLKADSEELQRTYFPNINPQSLTAEEKNTLISEIETDFKQAYIGIKKLPIEAKLGVFVAYNYYLKLLRKINQTPAKALVNKRIRVSSISKMYILFKSYFHYKVKVV